MPREALLQQNRRPGAACKYLQGDTMFTSVLTSRRRRTGRRQPADQRHGARPSAARAVCAAVAAAAALTTAGLAGAAAPALAVTRSPLLTWYNTEHAGYMAANRWFRFASTTLTVPPRIVPQDNSGDAVIELHATCPGQCSPPFAEILVEPGGGPGSISYQGLLTGGTFQVSPQVGDHLTVSVYYDRQGHDYFTATDLEQQTTQTIQLPAGPPNLVYDHAELHAEVIGDVTPPAADTRLWKFTGTRLTTYTGVHGTVQGPWQLTQFIKTTDGFYTGAVVASPSALRNGGQNFSVWLRHR
jgi:hypothetical protein